MQNLDNTNSRNKINKFLQEKYDTRRASQRRHQHKEIKALKQDSSLLVYCCIWPELLECNTSSALVLIYARSTNKTIVNEKDAGWYLDDNNIIDIRFKNI